MVHTPHLCVSLRKVEKKFSACAKRILRRTRVPWSRIGRGTHSGLPTWHDQPTSLFGLAASSFSHASDSLGYSPDRIRCAAAMTSARLNSVSFLRLTHGLSQPAF